MAIEHVMAPERKALLTAKVRLEEIAVRLEQLHKWATNNKIPAHAVDHLARTRKQVRAVQDILDAGT